MYFLVYYLVSAGLLALLISQCRLSRDRNRADKTGWPDAAFVGLALVTLLCMRLPSIFYNAELNPDESQTLGNAITLAQYPVYGRLVDGTTLGPLNAYTLLVPRLFGLPIDYTSARLMALLLIAYSLVLFYVSLRRSISLVASRLTLLIPVVFFGWSTSSDYLHYSSELTSLAIITSCVYLTIRLFQTPKLPGWLLWSLGAGAGLTPYCKLQTPPIVAMILLVAAWYLIQTRQRNAWRPICLLSAGFLLPSVVVFSLAYGFHVVPYFINFYFIGNLATYSQIYADVPLTHRSLLIKLLRFPLFSLHNADFFLYVLLNSTLIAGSALFIRWSLRTQTRFLTTPSWTARLLLLTAAGTLWAVIAPGTEFGHHLALLVFPLSWLTGLAIQYMLDQAPGRLQSRLVVAWLVVLMAEGATEHLLLPLAKQTYRQYQYGSANQPVSPVSGGSPAYLEDSNLSLFWFPNKTKLALSPVMLAVNRYAVPSDKLAVWGWACQYYVESQLVQGVSESHVQRSVIPNRMRNEYLDRYAHELQTNRPAIFLDAVGPSSPLLNKPQQRHEHFPGIDQIITKNYALVDSLDDVRIFIRRDRLISPGLYQILRPTHLYDTRRKKPIRPYR